MIQTKQEDALGDVEGLERRSILSPDLVDLSTGTPAYELFPIDLLQSAAARGISKETLPTYLQYGASLGPERFRRSIARWVDRELSVGTCAPGSVRPADPDEILVTNGASHSVDLVCKHFTQRGDTVLVEEVTYFLMFPIFREHGLNVVPVKMDLTTGVDLKDLEEKIIIHQPSLVYIIPTYHNPTGATVPAESRAALVEIVRSAPRQCYLVADEVYQFLYFYGEGRLPPPPLWCYDRDVVISLNSFSKLLAPGLRLGWIYTGNKEVLERLDSDGVAISGGGFNPFTSRIVYEAIESGALAKHVAMLRGEIRKRAEALSNALRRSFPEGGIEFVQPEGGYFVWATLGDKRYSDPCDMLGVALTMKTAFRLGEDCAVDTPETKEGAKRSMRLCFAHYSSDKLEEGAKRLAKTFTSTLNN